MDMDEEEIKMDIKQIGDRIKQARTLRNYTLDDVANEIGVAKSTIQRYENGLINKPKLPVLQAIADSLKVNPAWISGQDVPMERKLSLNFETNEDNTPFSRALAKLDTNTDSLTIEDKQAIKNELPKLIKIIPEAFEKIANNINDIFEEKLLTSYRYLNPDGKVEALKRIEELTYIPRYIEDNTIYELNAANELPGATTEDKAHDDAIMDDENF